MKLPPDGPQSLDVKHVSEGAPAAYPNGCHVCEVEIDPDTGNIEVVKYTAVNDFGTIINPMLVDGQIHGGVVQGIGQALLEHTVYDEQGQLLSGSYMDYALPRAHHAPDFAVHSHPVPAKTNPLGVKGCGEAGCAGSLTSIMNAVVDALSVYGIKHIDMPATPPRVWQAIQDAQGKDRAGARTAMTQATDLAFAARRAGEFRLIAGVSAAHFVSHYLHAGAAAAVRLRQRGLRRELHRDRPRADRVQRRVGGGADAGGLPGRPHQCAARAGRRPPARRGRACRRRGS